MPTKPQEELGQALFLVNIKVLGLVLGVVCGTIIFLLTNFLILKGGFVTRSGEVLVGPHLQLLGQFLLGYRVSFLGSIVGFCYGFALGTLAGSAIGWIYNKIANFRRG